MSTQTAARPAHYRTVNLPALGIHLPHLHGGFWSLQSPKPGAGSDYAVIVPHGSDFEVHDVAWGGQGKDLPGAACTWDGMANTEVLLASKFSHPIMDALRRVRKATGIDDLYVPSLREIKGLYASGCDAFKPDRAYWTSTQYSRNYAYLQTFGGGYTTCTTKDWQGGSVRFVRRSSIESLIN